MAVMELDGQAAIVTGGASGLGLATARRLSEAGMRVALVDRDPDRVQSAAAELGALGLAVDVTEADGLSAAVEEAVSRHGPPALAVACAGIAPAAKIVGKEGPHDLALFAQTVQVNLIGTFNLMRLVAPAMATRPPNADGERGLIVMTASVAAYEGQIGQAAYAASKAGVVGLTLPAAREFARDGIRVMTVAPGLFGTPMLLGMPQNVQDSLAATVPFPSRFGDPDEFARTVLHIADNPMLNGSVIRLDGAIRMQPR